MKLRLVSLIAQGVTPAAPASPSRLVDLSGLGREAWQGVDAEAYVQALGDDWDDRG